MIDIQIHCPFCDGYMHEVYFGDERKHFRCMPCDFLISFEREEIQPLLQVIEEKLMSVSIHAAEPP